MELWTGEGWDPAAMDGRITAAAVPGKAEVDSRSSGEGVGQQLQQKDAEIVGAFVRIGEATVVGAVDRDDATDPATKGNERVCRDNADSGDGLGQGSEEEIGREVERGGAEVVALVGGFEDRAGGVRTADELVAVVEGESIAGVHHEDAGSHRQKIGKRD